MDGLTLDRAAAPARNDLVTGRISRVSGLAKDQGEPEMVAQEIESLFATLLVSEMRKGLGDGFFGTGAGSDTFNGWFDEEIGSSLSSRGSLGLADTVREAMIREKAANEADETHRAQEASAQTQDSRRAGGTL